MKIKLGTLKRIIAEAVSGRLLKEVVCKKCKEQNEYAEPNQEDGSFVCKSCRDYYRIKAVTPAVAAPSVEVQPSNDDGYYRIRLRITGDDTTAAGQKIRSFDCIPDYIDEHSGNDDDHMVYDIHGKKNDLEKFLIDYKPKTRSVDEILQTAKPSDLGDYDK